MILSDDEFCEGVTRVRGIQMKDTSLLPLFELEVLF